MLLSPGFEGLVCDADLLSRRREACRHCVLRSVHLLADLIQAEAFDQPQIERLTLLVCEIEGVHLLTSLLG